MKDSRKLASSIIDRVIFKVIENNEDIERYSLEQKSLLYGEPYYKLEDEITELIENYKGTQEV